MELLEFACPHCTRHTRVASSFRGRRGKCPRCREWVDVPKADEQPLPPPPEAPEEDDDAELRPCEACGEPVRAAAKKCRHCGEFFGQRPLRAQPRHAPPELPAHLVLASPARRLGGFAIDELARIAPAALLIALGTSLKRPELAAVGVACAAVITVVQWYLIANRGQSIGKVLLRMRIVRDTGGSIDFVNGVVLRNWLLGLFENPFLTWVACVVFVVDHTLVFSKDRTCLHDLIARTRVVEVPSGELGAAA